MLNSVFELWLTFFKIGTIAFGGGYAMLPIIMTEVVTQQHWLTSQEFLNIVSISQVTPGPIAINSATYVGYKVAGVVGSLFATLGVVGFSLMATTILSTKLLKYREAPALKSIFKTLNPLVLALILSAGVGTGQYVQKSLGSVVIALIAVLWLWKVKGKSHWLMVLCGALGFVFFR